MTNGSSDTDDEVEDEEKDMQNEAELEEVIVEKSVSKNHCFVSSFRYLTQCQKHP